jgi:hypothetical protein
LQILGQGDVTPVIKRHEPALGFVEFGQNLFHVEHEIFVDFECACNLKPVPRPGELERDIA